MQIKYDHSKHDLVHSRAGPRAAFEQLFPQGPPTSLLDVGCGTGYWLAAAIEAGVTDVFGIDGVDIPSGQLLFPSDRFRRCDLTTQVDLGRRFEAAICLEVGEHLDIGDAHTLIDTLTRHADLIIFSGACPGQPGQNHVNCQWPQWWQSLYNERGFICEDTVRWRIWDDRRVEPWYRQNIFVARRHPNPGEPESRIKSVVHPELVGELNLMRDRMAQGYIPPLRWYGKTLPKAILAKLKRMFPGKKVD